MKIFIDTNIFIDYFAMRMPFYNSAKKLLAVGFLGEYEMWSGASQLTDIFYLLTNAKESERFTSQQAKEELKKLRQYVNICSLTQSDVDNALNSTWNDFEDACIYQCACKIKADAIITRNKKDFEKSSIHVFDCDEWFSYLKETKGISFDEIII